MPPTWTSEHQGPLSDINQHNDLWCSRHLKVIEDSEELLIMWIISINMTVLETENQEKILKVINVFKSNNYKPIACYTPLRKIFSKTEKKVALFYILENLFNIWLLQSVKYVF